MKLAPLTKDRAVRALEWRTEQRDILRTPYFLTAEMQEDFYRDVVCNRNSRHRFYAVVDSESTEYMTEIGVPVMCEKYVAMVGLVNIEWENSTAEISLITSESDKVDEIRELLFDEAFNRLNLHSVFGESYFVSEENLPTEMIEKYGAYTVWLPDRKYINGTYYSSLWWMITRRMYEDCR